MAREDPLYKAFLGEMEALEKFRITYTGLHPSAPLNRDDPDVRRLIEALAMFTARTRRASERSLTISMMRVFRQHFPHLLSPMPAMAMLHAKTDSRFVDQVTVPRGSKVALSPRDGELGSVTELSFRTLSNLRLLPVELDRVDIFRREEGGFRMLLRFESMHARPDSVEQINLYINHLNDFMSSLTVQHALKNHLRRAAISFDERVTEDTQGDTCQVNFGAPEVEPSQLQAFEHPLQRARSFLQFPQQEMFMNISVSGQAREEWRAFTLILDVAPSWPTELKLSPDTFQLHVTPIVNIAQQMSDPIECDGTKERYTLLHADAAGKYRMHSVLGVYRLDHDDGLIPLRPGVVGDERDAYEVEFEGKGDKRRGFVCLDFPAAFAEPFRVVADAFWHQPVLEEDSSIELDASLSDRYFDGVHWETLGAVLPGRDNHLNDRLESVLHLLSIKNQRFLGQQELLFLLDVLGVSQDRNFRDLVQEVQKVDIESKPYAKGNSGFKYTYRITYKPLDRSDVPLLDLFSRKLLEVLQVWSIEEVVELAVLVPSLELHLLYV